MNYWQESMTFAQAFRRELHAHPELTWYEERTAMRVREMLDSLDIKWRACAKTGTIAFLNPGSTGKHIALRADMDALPINEDTGKDWQSKTSGCMHACGHDGHTATLLATARWLKHHENSLGGPVSLVFQPAEEGGHGAREMIADGALEGVEEIYGWHNWPAIPFGKLACPDHIVMCGNGTFEIKVIGRGGHASQPELCRDPVLAASAINIALQQIISRRLPAQDTAVVSVTSIDARSEPTIIPQTALLAGSIRVSGQSVREKVNSLIVEISEETARSYGVECDVTIEPRYEATINHSGQAHIMREAWRGEFGDDAIDEDLSLPVMASEDFSYYLQEVPGAFALVGGNDGQFEHGVPCHSPHYDFNDQLIPLVSRLYTRLAGAPAP